MYIIPVLIPNSFASASASVSSRVSALTLISSANILPNNPIAPSCAPWPLHRCWSRTRLPSYVTGRVLGRVGVERLYGFDSFLLLVLSLRIVPIRWFDDAGSPIVLASPMLKFEPLGPIPEVGDTPEAVILTCRDCGDMWEAEPLARELPSAEVAYVAEAYGCWR